MNTIKPIVIALALSLMTTSCLADIERIPEATAEVEKNNLVKQTDTLPTTSQTIGEVADVTKSPQKTNASQKLQQSGKEKPVAETQQQTTIVADKAAENKTTQADTTQFSRVSQLLKVMRNDRDLVVSETGITELLSAIYKGAKGESKSQISTVIADKKRPLENDTVYKNANLMYVFEQKIVKKSYLENLPSFTVAYSLDDLNKQLSEKTGGAIKKAIDRISPNTKLILSNVMTFDGKWQVPFNPERTEAAEFTAVCDKGESKKGKVPMMQGVFPAQLFDNAIAIPFNEDYSMVIKLSDEKTNSTMEASKWLYDNTGEHIRKLLTSAPQKIMVKLPKFDLDIKHNLIPAMKKMGINDVFDKDKANLSKVSETKLFVDQFQQVIKFKADETGAKATAVTTATITSRSLQILPEFVANRPFSFAIVKTKTPNSIVVAGEINQLSICK